MKMSILGMSRQESTVSFVGQISSWDGILTLTSILRFRSSTNHLELVQTP